MTYFENYITEKMKEDSQFKMKYMILIGGRQLRLRNILNGQQTLISQINITDDDYYKFLKKIGYIDLNGIHTFINIDVLKALIDNKFNSDDVYFDAYVLEDLYLQVSGVNYTLDLDRIRSTLSVKYIKKFNLLRNTKMNKAYKKSIKLCEEKVDALTDELCAANKKLETQKYKYERFLNSISSEERLYFELNDNEE